MNLCNPVRGIGLIKALKINVAAQCVDMGAETEAPAELSNTTDLCLDAAVIEPGIEFEDHGAVAAFAPELPDKLVLRPKALTFDPFRGNRHEIGQNNFR